MRDGRLAVGALDLGGVRRRGGRRPCAIRPAVRLVGDRLLERADEVDRLGVADRMTTTASGRVRLANVFCLPVGMLVDERARGTPPARAARRSGVAEVVPQPVDVDGRVPVQGGGVELDRSDHAGAASRRRRFLAVVDGGEVVELVVDGMDTDRVGDLGGGVDVDVGHVGDHAAEQGDVHRVVAVGQRLDVARP